MFTRKNRKLGQGMTEYVIIVVLVAVAVLGAVKLFGGAVKEQIGIQKDSDSERTESGAINKIEKMNAK